MSHLDQISNPADIRKLSKRQLKELASEIRDTIIQTVAKQGGHLGPNLGVVELSIALHYVFDSPKDKLVWDVGHQSYPHKLLTGRFQRFHTLRQKGGISGYPNIEESEHDAFGTSHASTSISAALGMAIARDLKKESSHVVAIIGDGAISGGMSFEALNHAGHLQTNLIVILNDNEMSIAPPVGALSTYLSTLVTHPNYAKVRQKVKDTIRKLPAIGIAASKKLGELEDTMRSLSKEGMYFKALGFKYFGPVDGHDLGGLIKALRNIKHIKGPILLHVATKKGKGFPQAEQDKEKWHGVSPFDVNNGLDLNKSGAISYSSAFANALVSLAKKDQRIVAITAAMPKGTGLDIFAKAFPERCFDVAIAEQHAVTFAAGLARRDMKPVCAIYSTFLQRAFDQIVHDVCAQNLDVTFCLDRAGIVGEDGKLQHGAYDIAYLSCVPNMVVMAPKDENELGHLLKTAIDHKGPAAIRYPRGSGLGLKIEEPKKIPLGKGEITRKGNDVTLLSLGTCYKEAMQAAELLKKEGISAEVINARFAKPIDEALILKSVKKTKKLVTIEEGVLRGGFGEAVESLILENQIPAKVARVGLPDLFIEHGTPKELKQLVGLTPENIANVAKSL
ncbi:MAG: 1-deoxy-D-xylulose-5-phosphate synthase [Nanoarchaeota archaeon]|nr:1-deoxy-D-xylulose-5-phosphate synthase [Nanoarchaeota archaeon]